MCQINVLENGLSRHIMGLGYEDQKNLSVDLLNAYLTKHYSSNVLRVCNDLEISIESFFLLAESLPVLDLFFDPAIMCTLNELSVLSLEEFFEDFIAHLFTLQRGEKMERLLAQLCLLSWRECFVLSAQQFLAEIISNILANHLSASSLEWPFIFGNFFVSSEACAWEILFVSVLRIVIMASHKSLPSYTSASNRNLEFIGYNWNDLCSIYESAFEMIKESNDKARNLITLNIKSFSINAFEFIHQFCRACSQFKFEESYLLTIVPEFQEDASLWLRISLGHNLYLAQACCLLTNMPEHISQFLPESSQQLIVRDLACLKRFLVSSLANVEQGAREIDHAELIAWSIDRGIFVKDFALAFLKNSIFDDALCSAKVLPRLMCRVSVLALDSDTSIALIQKLSNLRALNLPAHHESLLKELMSLLPPGVKSEILARIHKEAGTCCTPLSPEASKFRCHMRHFFNRLAAGSGVSDIKPASVIVRPWRNPRMASTVSKEVLIEADLLLLTRPIHFLTELVRFPIIQNSVALLPLVFQILNHVNYSFEARASGTETSVLRQLVIALLALFDAEMSECEEMKRSWRDESHQRMVLMHYLPRTDDIDPLQIPLAAFFAAFTAIDADDDDANASTSKLRKLWFFSFACLLDQRTSWSQLMNLVSEDLLASRAHAEAITQSLALLLLPIAPADLPLETFAAPCVHLLERLRTPLAVRLCTVLLASCAPATDNDVNATTARFLSERLRATLSNCDDRGRYLLLQCTDFLPCGLLGTVVITVPRCLLRSKLIDVVKLNESANNRFHFIAEPSRNGKPFEYLARPLSSGDLEEVLHLVSLCNGVWHVVVNYVMKSSQVPEIRSLWNCFSLPTLILALYTFLHRIASLEEVDSDGLWARAIGFVDQLVAGGLITIPLTLRSSPSSLSHTSPRDILLGHYRGSLDLFAFVFALLRVVDNYGVDDPAQMVHLGRVCQTMAVLSQRLVASLAVPSDARVDAQAEKIRLDVIEQAVAVITEVGDYIKHRNVPAYHPLKHLSASLEVVAKSLICQQQRNATEEHAEDDCD